MAEEEPSGKLELRVTVAPAGNAVPYSADDKCKSYLQDCNSPAILAGKKTRLHANSCWQRAEVIMICAVIVIAWGLLTLPIIMYYHLPQVSCSTDSYWRLTKSHKRTLNCAVRKLGMTQFNYHTRKLLLCMNCGMYVA